MTKSEFIAAWLGELDDELAAARAELADAVAAHQAAEQARDAASAEHEVQRDALAVLKEPLASPLAARLRWGAQAAHDLDAAAKRAAIGVTNAREAVGQVHEAMRQLEHVAAHSDGEGALAAGERHGAETVDG